MQEIIDKLLLELSCKSRCGLITKNKIVNKKKKKNKTKSKKNLRIIKKRRIIKIQSNLFKK